MDRDSKGKFLKGHSSFAYKLMKRKIKRCLICGKEIIVRPCEEKAGKKFCCHSHYAEWLKGKVGYWKGKKRSNMSNEKTLSGRVIKLVIWDYTSGFTANWGLPIPAKDVEDQD